MSKVLTISDFVQAKGNIRKTKFYQMTGNAMPPFLKQLERDIREEFALQDDPIECHTAHQLTENITEKLQAFCDNVGLQLDQRPY